MDAKRVEQIFLDMYDDLRFEMFSITNDEDLVDDTYQNAYLRIHRYKKKKKQFYGNETSIKSLLRQMVRNLILDEMRINTRSKIIYTDETYMMTYNETPESKMITEEQARDQEHINKTLNDAFKLMTHDTYMTYKLRMKGVKFKEIAYLTDCGINTALGRMRYATLKIEEAFEKDGN
jgi:RNA polymerase sigma-70 factor (ECF subfamily)